MLNHVERLRQVAGHHHVDLAAAALQRAAADDRIDTVVVGVSSLQRLAQLQQLIDTVIPAEFWAAVDALGDPPQPGLDR